MRTRKFMVILIAGALVNLIAMGALVAQLPQEIPVHFNARFEVDQMGARQYLLLLPALALVMPCGVLAAEFLRGREVGGGKARNLFTSCFVTLFIALSWMLYSMSAMGAQMGDKVNTPLDLLIFLGFSAMLVVIGNYLPMLAPGRALGFRVKAALSNEECWRRTHRFGGLVFAMAGFVSAAVVLVGFFCEWMWLEVVGFLGCMLGANLFTLYYAVRVAKKLEEEESAS